MRFPFLCPQGHVLEGESAESGLETKCPQCGVAFYVPDYEPPREVFPSASSQATQQPEKLAGMTDLLDELGGGAASSAAPDQLMSGGDLSSGVVHIPCPNGHELETPFEMLGLEAYCPYCGDKFRLKEQNSVEYQRQQAIVDAKRAKIWFNVAVGAAGFILVGLPLLMLISCLARG